MKTKTIFISTIIVFLFPKITFSQCGNNAVAVLNPNKIKTAIPTGGTLFWNGKGGDEQLSFIAPYTPGEPEVNSILTVGLWQGGYNEDGELAASCQKYGLAYEVYDYWPGPLNNQTGEVFENGCENFDVVWIVRRGEVTQLIDDFEDNGNIDSPIARNILRWPGKGNPHFENEMGFELPDQDLAPFFDRNNNGIYEPLNGEYPIIDVQWPDVIPNEMTWSVYNDMDGDFQSQTFGNRIGVEVHEMAFGFNCENDETLNHTIFTRHKIINKSGGDISEYMVGAWTVSELGCPKDNYIGCDTALNTSYTYNRFDEDGIIFCTGPDYGERSPALTTTLLNRPMDYHMYHFSDIGICEIFQLHGPNGNEEEHYNFLVGKWKDGHPLSTGGAGYNLNGEITPYAFPSHPLDTNGWSMNQENISTGSCGFVPIISSGPHLFTNGETFEFDMAYSFHRHPDSNHIGNLNYALNNIPHLQSFFDNGFNECKPIVTSTDDIFSENINLEISPNPNNGQFSIFSKNNSENISLELFNLNGQKIWSGKMNAGQEKIEINLLENISRGIYFLKSTIQNGEFYSQKIIIK